MTEDEEETLMENMYMEFLLKINEYIEENIDPLSIAAVLLTQSLSIYKTTLSPEDYDSMISNILRHKDDIVRFSKTESNFGGRLH